MPKLPCRIQWTSHWCDARGVAVDCAVTLVTSSQLPVWQQQRFAKAAWIQNHVFLQGEASRLKEGNRVSQVAERQRQRWSKQEREKEWQRQWGLRKNMTWWGGKKARVGWMRVWRNQSNLYRWDWFRSWATNICFQIKILGHNFGMK